MQPYQPRDIQFDGITDDRGYSIKCYRISMDGTEWNHTPFADGIALAVAALPHPAGTDERPGVGFLIAHCGNGIDYCVLAWWDRENELPFRVFVRERGAAWRAARGSESVCVWDLQVIAHERDAYVRHVMNASRDVDAYLADVLSQKAGSEGAA